MTSIISATAKSGHASWRQLSLVFALALLLFLMLRWQPEPWLQQQIDQQARNNGIDLQYDTLHLDGLSIRMDHVLMRIADMPTPVALDSLGVGPAWSSLLTGVVAVDAHASVLTQPLNAVLVWQDHHMLVRDLHADLDVAALQPLWKQRMPLPVDVSGRLKLSGHVQLDAASGVPLDGQITVLWQQAGIDLPVFDKPLGDYQLALKAVNGTPGKWQWSISGGATVVLSGSGQLDLSSRLPQQWSISGRVQAQAAPEAKTVAALLGGRTKIFNISGNLLHARIQPALQ